MKVENKGGEIFLKLSQELNESLNEQVLHELRNQNIYYQISSYFEDMQLKNLANYFQKQANHENEHAQKFIKHINDRTGGKVSIGDVDSPNLNINSIDDIANIYVKTEESTTESIEELYSLAFETKSFIDLPFLSEMLSEQVEEEDTSNAFATKLKMCKDLVLFDATFVV